MQHSLSLEFLRKYVSMRRSLDGHLDAVRNLANVMCAFDQCDRDKLTIDPQALSFINQQIVNHVLDGHESLEKFLNLSDVKVQLVMGNMNNT